VKYCEPLARYPSAGLLTDRGSRVCRPTSGARGRSSVVPLEIEADGIEVALLRETVVLSREVDLVAEVRVHRAFGAELVERSCPAVVSGVVEPLDVEEGHHRMVCQGELTGRLNADAVASRVVAVDPAQVSPNASLQPHVGRERCLPLEGDDAATLGDLTTRIAGLLEYSVVADSCPEVPAALPVLGLPFLPDDRLEGTVEVGGKIQ